MLKGKWKLFICIALVTCVIFAASNDVFAAINDSYHIDTPVADANLDDKIKNSSLLEAIGSLIYAVGSLMEWCLGKVFQLITGTNMFPWADAILFNAVPFLDVNIFTAAGGSLVAILYDFLTGTYYSLLTLASTFFGIAVMFSAVKLAITAIAEDKAKYKKAIVDWLLGLVMLWGMHFFISFVLYLNEQLVVVASNIVSESTAKAGDAIAEISDTTEYNTKIVYNFVDLMESGKETWLDKAKKILTIVGAVIVAVVIAAAVVAAFAASGGTVAAVIGAVAKVVLTKTMLVGTGMLVGGILINTEIVESVNELSNDLQESKADEADDIAKTYKEGDTESDTKYNIARAWLLSESDTVEIDGVTYTYRPVDIAAALLKSDYYTSHYYDGLVVDAESATLKKKGSERQVTRLFVDAYSLTHKISFDENGNKSSSDAMLGYTFYKAQLNIYDSLSNSERTTENYNKTRHQLYTIFCNIVEQYVLNESSDVSVIYNLATYFKETSFSTSETGWKASKAVVQNAIMYVLLVCYSLVFFISYTKRLFYVIMLILMAPIVVVFDFFLKFGK